MITQTSTAIQKKRALRLFQSTRKPQSLYYFLLLVTPIIFVTNTNELYEFPKMFSIYLVGSTIIFFEIVRCILYGKKLTAVKWPSKLVLSFLGANVLATIASTHVYTSLWGYYTRFNGGLASLLIFVGLHTVVLNNKNTFKNMLIPLTCLSLLPISIYGVLQHFKGISRVHSTLGQPNWLAACLAMTLPVVIFGIFANAKEHPNNHSKTVTKGLLITYLFGFATLWYTYSLSGILGFCVGMATFLVMNKKLVLQNKRYLWAIILLTVVIAVSNMETFSRRVEDALIDMVYAQGKKHNISDTGFIRTHLWRGTIKLVMDNPKNLLLGTGPETFPYEFQKYRPHALNYSSEWNFILNKPHNYYLEILAELGVLGLLPYLLLLVMTVRKRHPLLTPALIAFYVTNLFGWPTVTTNLLFWTWLALL